MRERLERCIEPFYNHTLTVSNEVPNLGEYLGITWGIADLIDDVVNEVNAYYDIGSKVRDAFRAAPATFNKVCEVMRTECIFHMHRTDW
jgi:hypothetical protein